MRGRRPRWWSMTWRGRRTFSLRQWIRFRPRKRCKHASAGGVFLREKRAHRDSRDGGGPSNNARRWSISNSMGRVADGFLPLANELARRLSSEARRFGTGNENAFRFYGEALAATGCGSRERAIEAAEAADPGFAWIYRDQARLLAGTGARDRALQVIQAGRARERLDSIDRADLQYVAAAVSGDRMRGFRHWRT